ncbi:hypothetical protein SAMN05444483_102320 [Salegentibacter echinorum]|uniref:Uncharacterized protein n=1 Tax=Salegentibacter echinorum TaxID=1073325 RepID=A0A1M5ECL6_SALEC|nr:hypothetical protein [Salegentibacter echinorum]SHF76937.1 hypothetical protein SAMN05444483_102320 [Salegentibacter echinorum]
MESKNLANSIAFQLFKVRENKIKVHEIIGVKQFTDDDSWIVEENKLNESLEAMRLIFQKDLLELKRKSLEDDYYFFDCSFQVYTNTYQHRFREFQDQNYDAEQEDFLKYEIEKHFRPFQNRFFWHKEEKMDYSEYAEDINCFNITLRKKQHYLVNLLKDKGWSTKVEILKPSETELINNSLDPVTITFSPLELENFSAKTLSNDSILSDKIKWNGGPAQLGFIFRNLVEEGYIDSPVTKEGEVNCSAFARQLIEHFNLKTTPASLAKYLNLQNSKFEEASRNFLSEDFNLPDIRRVS